MQNFKIQKLDTCKIFKVLKFPDMFWPVECCHVTHLQDLKMCRWSVKIVKLSKKQKMFKINKQWQILTKCC